MAYSLYVLYLLFRRDEYSKKQKIIQAIMIFAIPLLGPIFIHLVIREYDRTPKKRGPNDGMGGSSIAGGGE